MNRIKEYIEDVIKEMRKVNWPKRTELIANTGIVLVGTLILSVFIFGADRIINALLDFIYT